MHARLPFTRPSIAQRRNINAPRAGLAPCFMRSAQRGRGTSTCTGCVHAPVPERACLLHPNTKRRSRDPTLNSAGHEAQTKLVRLDPSDASNTALCALLCCPALRPAGV